MAVASAVARGGRLGSRAAPRLPTEAELLSRVRRVQGRARTRTLDAGDVSSFLDDVRFARRFARRHGLPESAVQVIYDGGSVPTGYGYRAETTILRYDGGDLSVERGAATSYPWGEDPFDGRRVRVRATKSLFSHPERLRGVRFHGGWAYLGRRPRAGSRARTRQPVWEVEVGLGAFGPVATVSEIDAASAEAAAEEARRVAASMDYERWELLAHEQGREAPPYRVWYDLYWSEPDAFTVHSVEEIGYYEQE